MHGEFKSANELVFAGYSAGAVGLGFNSDLIKKYKNPKVIVDSFWLDSGHYVFGKVGPRVHG